jgi:RNA polymerase sigma factor (sigma-70 family)
MASHGLRRTLDRLRQALTPQNLTDEVLLRQFIAVRDEAAFAMLVRRHGPMVLGVSRRVLGNWHDSEDVFQATFLVLAQKAQSVVARQALPSWLYMVAYRTALKAKTRNDRRRRKERQVEIMPHPAVPPAEAGDWRPVLDRELSRLPEKYRMPVIMCDLEGRTRKDVERQLGLREGTLSSRLTTARRILAKRLSRRGVTLSGGALATALSETTASAYVSSALVDSTAKAAVLVAAGKLAAVSASVAFLMKGALQAMFIAKLKAFALVAFIAILGAGGLAYTAGGQTAAKAPPKSELEVLRAENELLKVNLRVTLEKIQALEKELAAFKGKVAVRHRDLFDKKAVTDKAVTDYAAAAADYEAAVGQAIRFLRQTQADKGKDNAGYRVEFVRDKEKEATPDTKDARFGRARTAGKDRGDDRQEALRRAAEALEHAARVLREQGARKK